MARVKARVRARAGIFEGQGRKYLRARVRARVILVLGPGQGIF